jgi:RNA polymerase sigma-70 factor, ECF subfamily
LEPIAQDSAGIDTPDAMFEQTAATYGAALERLARAYEPDADRRRDLLQEIHLALWRSFAVFDGRCSLRTWVYRIAHNTATSQVLRRKTNAPTLVGLDELEAHAEEDTHAIVGERHAMDRLLRLIHRLQPIDRQIILLYLEGLDAASIGEITGLSSGNVATKVHRIKAILRRQFHSSGGGDD